MERTTQKPLEPTISMLSAVDLTKKSIKEHEVTIDKLFSDLNSLVESLSSEDKTSKVEIIEKCEYLIFQLRVKLSWEQTKLKDVNSSDIYPQVLALLRREVAVSALLQRLNELREDVTIIQKILWIKSNKNLF